MRDVAVRLNDDARIGGYSVEAENFESIHNHSAYARIARGLVIRRRRAPSRTVPVATGPGPRMRASWRGDTHRAPAPPAAAGVPFPMPKAMKTRYDAFAERVLSSLSEIERREVRSFDQWFYRGGGWRWLVGVIAVTTVRCVDRLAGFPGT